MSKKLAAARAREEQARKAESRRQTKQGGAPSPRPNKPAKVRYR